MHHRHSIARHLNRKRIDLINKKDPGQDLLLTPMVVMVSVSGPRIPTYLDTDRRSIIVVEASLVVKGPVVVVFVPSFVFVAVLYEVA